MPVTMYISLFCPAFAGVHGFLGAVGPLIGTDVFKKGIGDEKTAELFRNILFGTAR